jgi:protein-S-isoprenylcysteine O-methyltransferase Ste14
MGLSRQALAFTLIPLLGITAILVVSGPTLQWDAMRVMGLALAVLGFALLTLARAQLGKSFSVTPQARALVTTGLYSKIRHPIYVFGTICLVGFVMFVGAPKLLLLFVLLVPVQLLRMRAEGRKLEERFGEEYRAWKSQTWF